MKSISFEEYYKKNLNLNEKDFQEFLRICNEPLPITFRVENNDIFNTENLNLKNFQENDSNDKENNNIQNININNNSEDKNTANSNNINQLQRIDLFESRSFQIDSQDFKESALKKPIIVYTEAGWIYRQELVSMFPVYALKIEPSNFVLDMCAAPGSKTTQIVQILRNGLLVSNDSNLKRCEIIRMHCKKYAFQGHLITNNDARFFPKIIFSRETHSDSNVINNDGDITNATLSLDYTESSLNSDINSYITESEDLNASNNQSDAISSKSQSKNATFSNKIDRFLKFDRILCDVPCSGDGTMRKAPRKTSKWKQTTGISLAPLQFSILKRGLELLEEDGLLCYSTCSLNPVENEAIVQKALNEMDCELVDIEMPKDFKCRKGLIVWDIFNDNKECEWLQPCKLNIGLDKCVRILPNDNNTGGFFLALFRKKRVKKVFNLQLDSENSIGLGFEVNARKGSGYWGTEFCIKDLKTKEKVGISLGAKKNDILESVDINSSGLESESFSKMESNRTDKKNSEELIQESNRINQTDLNLKKEKRNITDLSKKSYNKKENKEDDFKKETNKSQNGFDHNSRKMIRKSFNNDHFYEIENETKEEIEKSLKIKITTKLITQSKTRKKCNIVSNEVYKILKNSNKALKIVSAGCNAFESNNLEMSYRARSGILEKFGYNGIIYELNLANSLFIIKNGKIENEKLNNNNKLEEGNTETADRSFTQGFCVFKLFKMEKMICGHSFQKTSVIFMSKKSIKAYEAYLQMEHGIAID